MFSLTHFWNGTAYRMRGQSGYVYPDTNHGFFNDTTPRYDKAASKLAWNRTLAWFVRSLRA